MKNTAANLPKIDIFSYEVTAALLALDYLDSLPSRQAAGLRKISAHTGVAGIRMLSIMRTLYDMGCVGFSIEDRAGYYINKASLDKSLRQLIFALNRDIRINGKSHKDPRVNIDGLSEGACEAMGRVKSLVLAALDIPLKDFIGNPEYSIAPLAGQRGISTPQTQSRPYSIASNF